MTVRTRLIVLALLASLLTPCAQAQAKVKNVILLIASGAGSEHFTLARWLKGAPLALDPLLTGVVRTRSTDSVLGGPASAATAYATGVLTGLGRVSLGPGSGTLTGFPEPPEAQRDRPLATVLEGAKLLGMATGLVSDSRVCGPLTAAFAGHAQDFGREEDLMEEILYQSVDLVFGGGMAELYPKEAGGNRLDGEDLRRILALRRYPLITTRDQLGSLTSKAFGIFAPMDPEPEIDRPRTAPSQPRLSDMTRTALDLLSTSQRGFFLVVAAGQINEAIRANDPAWLLGQLLEYDRAAAVALDFAKGDGDTLLVAVSDRSAGGLSVGNEATVQGRVGVEALTDPLRRMQASSRYVWGRVGPDPSPERVTAMVREHWGQSPTAEEARRMVDLAAQDKTAPWTGLGRVFTPAHTLLGFTTSGSTAGGVPLFSFGPGRPGGMLEAPDVGRALARALGLDLEQTTARLFVDPAGVFGQDAVVVEGAATGNPIIRIEYRGYKYWLPAHKDFVSPQRGEDFFLEGITVYVPQTGKAYIPMQAVQYIRGEKGALPQVAR